MNLDTSRPATAQRRNGATAQRRNGATAQRLARRLGANCVRLAAAVLVLLLTAVAGRADGLPYTFTKVGPEYRLTLQPNPALYFGFQHSVDLLQPFAYIKMALGDTGPIFGYTPLVSETQGFLRARGISVSTPEDQDGDFMDDLWELQHSSFNGQPYLDPLNPNDAFQLSPESDAGGRNNLDYYLFKRGITRLREVYSREATVFNFGQPTAGTEAISRAVSLFNGESIPTSGIPEVYSREVSLFNFGSPSANVEAVSRETTVFNFGSPPANMEAIGREVSVFNGESVPSSGIPEVYSREVTTFNFGAPTAGTEAISREVTVYNTPPAP